MPPSGGIRTSLVPQAKQIGSAWTTAPVRVSYGGFTNGPFAPGQPLTPPDPQPIRAFDYSTGVNLNYTPRSTESFGMAHLRAFSNVELVRLAIETRKDQVERVGWQIKPKEGVKATPEVMARAKKLQAFWKKPDGINHFATWMRLLMEDVLVLDAPSVEKRRNRGGELISLDVIDGATIKPLVDISGRRPLFPDPSYQQIVKGVPWADLTTRDLAYSPRNPRTNHLYGFGPVEQCIVTIHTCLNRQARQLAWFTDGNTPPGLLTVPDGWTPDNIKEYQQWFDDRLSGNTSQRTKLLWGPNGAAYIAFKDPPLKDDFDEWLARVVCYCFSLPPTPFIKQMNRATAQNADTTATEEGREPYLLWAKRFIDSIIEDDQGEDELEFCWNTAREVEPKTQAEIDDTNLRNGTEVIDDIRARRGQEPLPNGLGKVPIIITATGAVTLDSVINPPDPVEPAAAAAPWAKPAPKPAKAGAQKSASGKKPAAGKKEAEA